MFKVTSSNSSVCVNRQRCGTMYSYSYSYDLEWPWTRNDRCLALCHRNR